MKKWKAVLALLLVAALCLALFAACAKTETPAKPAAPAKTDTTPAKTDEPAKTEEPAKTDEPAPADEPEQEKSLVFEEGEVRDFKMVYFDLRMVAGDHGERVQDAINEYIVPKYGLRIDLDYYTIGDWMTKIMVALAGGERVDFMPYLFATSITNM